jgi:hypothetical protein
MRSPSAALALLGALLLTVTAAAIPPAAAEPDFPAKDSRYHNFP